MTLSTKHHDGLRLGIDVGGTHLRVALVTGQGQVVAAQRQQLDARDPSALLLRMQEARSRLPPEAQQPLPIGVGIAGQILVASGTVAVAPNLAWRDVPFGPMLARTFGQPVRMLNDLNAITLGEAVCGAGGGTQDVVCVFVGTGVGMGAVAAGQIVEGHDGLATELGHVKVDSVGSGRLCGCGERGCLEAYTSGRHLPDLLAAKVASGVKSPLFEGVQGDLSRLTAGYIEVGVSANDPGATALWDDVSALLARSIGDVVTLFNPNVLILGGGVLGAAPTLHRLVLERIRMYAARPAQRNLKICASVLGDDAGVIGAALAAQ